MFRAPAALVVFGARAGRLALPVSLCLFGASTADCTKRKVTKPKGACWEAYKVVPAKTPGGPKGYACIGFNFCRKVYWQYFGSDGVCALSVLPTMKAMVAEFQAMKDSPDADPGGVMTPQHWDIAEQIVRVRIEGGAAHGEGRKVGLILPHHTVAHLLNPFTKELSKDENGLNNPAARMPNDASRSLNFIFTKLFKGDAAKVQFLNYWSELGPFKAMCDKFRANLKDAAMASITVGCVRVERSIKVQKMIHSKVRNRLLHHKVEMLVQIYMNARLGKAPACEVTSLEDMLEPESEEQMEAILGDMVDEAIRTVESKDAEDVVVIE
ncbi:hypothetical protein M885DRAFT_570251 [Pelagophyceae sp. CCMP2097]|nr:hypothetical protein M885DRAFT_570251 [Pelagophyceae sp. CCMP2097]